MEVRIVEHAKERAKERGASFEEIIKVIKEGNKIDAKKGRKGKEMVFEYGKEWEGKIYKQKKVIVVYVEEGYEIVVITVKVFYGQWR